jgi:NADH-quinone oxidoreductase subunit I
MVADERKPGEEHLYREEKYARIYEIDMLRCIFCGLCEEACPKEAIFLTKETVASGFYRDVFVYGKDRLLEPSDPDKRIDISKRLTPEVIKFKQDKKQKHNR